MVRNILSKKTASTGSDPTTSSIFFSVCILRIWRKCDLSEIFLDTRASALQTMQFNHVNRMYPKLDRRLKWKIQVLEDRLSRPNAISPYFAFNMNRSTFLPGLATVLTYLIIVIQFKLTEVPDDSVSTISNSTFLNFTT